MSVGLQAYDIDKLDGTDKKKMEKMMWHLPLDGDGEEDFFGG